MRIAIITINEDGQHLAKRLKASFPGAKIFNGRLSGMNRKAALKYLVKGIFNEYDGLIFIAALGITVRLINDLIRSKLSDPAVVSVDTAGRFSISVVSGHEGGANNLAYRVASVIAATPIITTGSESRKKITMGIGCRKGISQSQVQTAVHTVLASTNISLDTVRCAASVDIKKNENGLISACEVLKLPIIFFSLKQIRIVQGICLPSDAARHHLGINGVCEPCALLAGHNSTLIVPKQIVKGVTIACAKENFTL